MKKVRKNRNDLRAYIICSLLMLTQFGGNLQAQLAFPTAEGYGKNTVGGRGGTIYEVTNLNDAGAGSLRAAVEASGPRIVVFRVSGTINLTKNLTISNPNITIAGQTAPGDGICIKKYTFNINADQVIVRYIRARYGDELKNDADAVSMRYRKNIIIDHVSASWGDDETLSLYHGENITVQWCMITETLNRGGDHGFAGIWGSPYSSFHHNLVAHCVSRNMRFASGCGNTDYRNNVIYNWGYNTSYGGEQQQVGNATYNFSNINMVNNYYKPGPATQSAVNHRIVNPTYRNVKADYGKFYVAGNYIVGNTTVTADNWNGGVDPQGGSGDISYVKLNSPWPAMAINQQSAQDAYQSVVTGVGCSYPKRDAVDTRIINEVKNGTATYGANGIIESQSQVGGWPALNSTTPPADSDHDGMPDSWETANGLNPNNAADRNNIGAGGYTMVEIYINSLVDGATNVPVSGISISPAAATIGISQTMPLAAIFSPSNASNQNVTWSSNNTSVATVSAAGVVTGVNAGTAVITVTSQDGGHTGTSQVTITSSSSAVPLIKMLFNENTSSSVANTGSVPASFAKTNPPAWSVNVPVNGGASALDFGTATGNYSVESASVINQLAGLTSFTITGWVNCRSSTTGAGGNRIVSWIKNGGNGVDLVYLSNGSLKLGINQWPDASAAVSNTGKIPANSGAPASNWRFFAVTYQSSTGSLSFYFGDNTVAASLDKTVTYNQGAVGANIGKLAVGHFNSESSRTTRTDRMFRGLIDQVEIYGSVLSLTEIQTVQNIGGAGARSSASVDGYVETPNANSNMLELFPNPAREILNVKLNGLFADRAVIYLYDNSGRLIQTSKVKGAINPIDIKGLPTGVYLIKVKGDKISALKRFTK